MVQHSMKQRLRVGLTALAAALLLGAFAAPAQAQARDASTAAAAPAYCSDATFGGTYICAYGRRFHKFANGTRQIFVIGTNFAVYTKWKRPNGTLSDWVSLGGEVRHTYGEDDFYIFWCSGQSRLDVYVYGTNGKLYSKPRISTGKWLDWAVGTRICFDDDDFPG